MPIPTSLFDPAQSSIEAVTAAIDGLNIEGRAWIDGAYVATAQHLPDKTSPVDGRTLQVSAGDAADIDRAVSAARCSFDAGAWSQRTNTERRATLLRLADAMELARPELALLDALETGRALQNYYHDSIPKAVDALRWFATNADRCTDTLLVDDATAHAVSAREPLGVVGLIVPWNDPLVVFMWKLGAALMMGNSVVVKPSENASLSILKVAALAQQSGLPDGVLNVVPGQGSVAGEALALHRDVDAIGFTGSSATAKRIQAYAGQSNMKRVELECGGKSAFVVSRYCTRLREAAACLAQNMFYNQGQICSAPSRLIIERPVRDQFLEYLLAAAPHYCPGHPFDLRSKTGTVVNAQQKARIDAFIVQAQRDGARLLNTPCQPAHPLGIAPHIFEVSDPHCALAQEEIFGPVLAVFTVDTLDQAIALANDTRYGLASAIWSDDADEAESAPRRLRAGIVHVNSYGADTMEAPFGGIKESGIGKDKSLLAFDSYSILKTIWRAR